MQSYDFATHPTFAEYSPWQGTVKAGFDVNFLGQMTNVSFFFPRPDYAADERYQRPPYPALSEETFEWLAFLTAVKEARERFVMIEGGAGWGRWIVGAACAIRATRPDLRFNLMGVEAHPTHFGWMKEHFRDNGLDPDAHRLIFGAVADQDGEVTFDITGDPAELYGHAIVGAGGASSAHTRVVPSYSIRTLLAEFDRVDLMDFDIQGAEWQAISAGIDAMNKKVRSMFVGTHGSEIESMLIECFLDHGWQRIHTFGMGKTEATPYGLVKFGDGVQCWLNPRL